MKVRDYIERHKLYEGNKFCLLYEEFLLGEKEASGRRYTDSMTLHLEGRGQLLIARNKVKDVDEVNIFVKDVLKWGGKTGHRVRGQLYKNNSEQKVASAVEKASRYLQAGNLRSAIETITSLKGLSISYGSKILRMLAPQQVGVLDSFLDGELCYSMTEAAKYDSWVEFCSDCGKETQVLRRKRIKNRFRVDGEWYAADVEAVIFRHIDSRKEKQKRKRK